MSYSSRQDFSEGFMSAIEKRAGLAAPLGLLNTAANIRTLGDMTNAELGLIMDDDLVASGIRAKTKKDKPKAKRLSVAIDDSLLKNLTPEQRKELFFAVRRIKAAGAMH